MAEIWAQLAELEEQHRSGALPVERPLQRGVDLDQVWALCAGGSAEEDACAPALWGLGAALRPMLPHEPPLRSTLDPMALRHSPAHREGFAELHAVVCAPHPSLSLLTVPLRVASASAGALLRADSPMELPDPVASYVAPGEDGEDGLEKGMEREGGSRECIGFSEGIKSSPGLPGASSMSLQRKPGHLSEFVRGNSQNVPFAPGGADTPQDSPEGLEAWRLEEAAAECVARLKDPSRRLDVLPTLDSRVSFSGDGKVIVEKVSSQAFNDQFISQPPAISSTVSSPSISIGPIIISSEPEARIALLDLSADLPWTEPSEVPELEEILSGAAKELGMARKELGESQQARDERRREEAWARIDRIDVSDFHLKVPSPAIEYPFDLDRFQKEAIFHLEQSESVFVAAHTSAGKTVVAEYAIALASRHHTRAIYTSPIKALSNQKYRDFKDTFGDVGLITGDVQVSPEASCLVVTTEILRSMLYKGADLIRDVEWVIFDEVHYVNDLERGVVWEEVIIMLPKHVNLIFLSATVPNTFEFADWVGRTKRKKIWVISTDHRPTPLEHYLAVDDQLFKILDAKKSFLQLGYKNATNYFHDKDKLPAAKSGKPAPGSVAVGRGSSKSSSSSKASASKSPAVNKAIKAGAPQTSAFNPNQNKGGDRARWVKMIQLLKKADLLPAVVFAFSKKKCQQFAEGLTSVDLTSGKQQTTAIHHFIEASLGRLSEADRQVPQVQQMRDLLKRGIGVHHGGLLPILKEVVEILFSRGLIKVLFATETFAMGVNMPARTVVFEKIRKHDGQSFRDLLPGEYIQMSGRAGRRGLDTVGTVIILCWGDMPDSACLSQMMTGAPTKLVSQFRLTYNMILNLLRVQDFRVEDMMKRSFSEVHSQKNIPLMQRQLAQARADLAALDAEGPIQCIFGEPDIEDYFTSLQELQLVQESMSSYIVASGRAMTFLAAGRVVVMGSIRAKPVQYAAVVRVEKSFGGTSQLALVVLQKSSHALLEEVPLSKVSSITTKRLTLPADAKGASPHAATVAKIADSLRAATSGSDPLPLLDPVQDFKIDDLEFHDQLVIRDRLTARKTASKCHECPKLTEHLTRVAKREHLKGAVHDLSFSLSDENLFLMPEFEARLRLLSEVEYVDSGKAVSVKGRVAREFNTASCELLATELVFHNVFAGLEPAEMISLLSILVFVQKSDTQPLLSERLQASRASIVEHANRIATLQRDCGLLQTPEEYLKETLHFGLMEIAYEWARGMPFAEICTLSADIQEGSIVRCITRLDETCKEMRNVARIIGDSSLYTKAEEASALIKRDIVFASSLYIQ